MTITTGGPSTTGGSKAIGQTTADDSHTHACTTTTDAGSNIPPYMEVIFAQRNDPAVSTSLGSEEPQETDPGEEEVTYNYVYDGDGQMVIEATGTITTVYIGGIYEYEISGAEVITRSYYYAGSQRVAIREGDTLFYLLGDHLGSTSLTLDASGNKVAEQRYKPYGSTRYEWGTAQTQYQFTGQRKIELGIYYFQARFYDAALGQFLSPDSIIPSPGNVLDWNRYLYTRANPLRFLDPTGHFCVESGNRRVCSEDTDNNVFYSIPKFDPLPDVSDIYSRESLESVSLGMRETTINSYDYLRRYLYFHYGSRAVDLSGKIKDDVLMALILAGELSIVTEYPATYNEGVEALGNQYYDEDFAGSSYCSFDGCTINQQISWLYTMEFARKSKTYLTGISEDYSSYLNSARSAKAGYSYGSDTSWFWGNTTEGRINAPENSGLVVNKVETNSYPEKPWFIIHKPGFVK